MSKECESLHNLFNSLKRFKFPFSLNEIPLNGIYILFEKNEKAHGQDRIVRIGTHTGENQLPSRLMQHFVTENKDRSIFRKNIGRALLNKVGDTFLSDWEIDRTTRKAREKIIDEEKLKIIERAVSECIQKNFEFAVFEINNKDKRLELESKIISAVSLCKECRASENWLGNFSPKEKIKKSGLWLVNELWKEPITEQEVNKLTQHGI